MFSRLATLLPIAALVAVATAAPGTLEARNPECSTGPVYCCNQVFNDATDFTGIFGGLLTAVVGAGIPIGLTCDPITVIGLGNGGTCTTQAACCTDNSQNGLVNIECVPISASL